MIANNRRRLLPLVFLFCVGVACDKDIAPPVARATPTPPEPTYIPPPLPEDSGVKMYVMRGMDFSGDGPDIIFWAKPDGGVAWSADRLRGGGTLRTGWLTEKQLQKLRNRLADAAQPLGSKGLLYSGPDAAYTAIQFQTPRGENAMFGTWHELAEAGGRVVATTRGLEPRGSVIAEDDQSPEVKAYRQFRAAWTEFRKAVDEAIGEAERNASGGMSSTTGRRTQVCPPAFALPLPAHRFPRMTAQKMIAQMTTPPTNTHSLGTGIVMILSNTANGL